MTDEIKKGILKAIGCGQHMCYKYSEMDSAKRLYKVAISKIIKGEHLYIYVNSFLDAIAFYWWDDKGKSKLSFDGFKLS